MTAKEKEALLAEVNSTFNEMVKYMQFRFQQIANTIAAIPTVETAKEEKKTPV